MKKKCIFCQCDDRKITKEHVFPDWLSKMYGNGVTSVNEGVNADGTVAYRYQSKIFQRTVNCVCEVCNNGWMSEIENYAKPILIKMLNNKAFVLDKKSQMKISTWAMKTILVLNHDNPAPPAMPFIPKEHYISFYESKTAEVQNIILLGNMLKRDYKGGDRIASNWLDVASHMQVPVELADDFNSLVAEGRNMYGATLNLANIVFQMFGNNFYDGTAHKVEMLIPDEPLKVLNPHKNKIRWPLKHTIDEFGGLEVIHNAIKGAGS